MSPQSKVKFTTETFNDYMLIKSATQQGWKCLGIHVIT